jgi:hypothetical protein
MLSNKLQVPFRFRCLLPLGKALERFGIEHLNLDADNLREAASQLTGLSDFGAPPFEEAFEVLLKSLHHDADLNPIGRYIQRRQLLNYLSNRLRLTDYRKRAPSAQLSTPPLIVLGIPRSGTTLLHRLLAEDPANRALPFWQLMRPFPVRGADPSEPDPRRAGMEKRLRLQRRLVPSLDAKHHVRADSPEECMWMLGLTFVSLVFWVFAPVYSYLQWFLSQDRLEKYRDYASLLNLLDKEQPGQRLTLKAPAHTGSVREIIQSVPGAMLVQIHRDPATCLASFNSLLYSNYHAVTNRVDVRKMSEANLQLFLGEHERNQEAREEFPGAVFDVDYQRLVQEPIQTIQRIYAHYGLGWAPDIEEGIKAYLAENPKGIHGAHQYDAADFEQEDASELIRRQIGG